MVRRKKLTIFLDAKENTSVYDVKRMIEGITKRKPEEQMLYKDDGSGKWDTPLGNDKFLADYNLDASTAKAQLPATLGLSFLGMMFTNYIVPFIIFILFSREWPI